VSAEPVGFKIARSYRQPSHGIAKVVVQMASYPVDYAINLDWIADWD
jgi:hypothetical protein